MSCHDQMGGFLAGAEQDIALIETLRLAVPLWIEDLRCCTPGQRAARAKRCATEVGTRGDLLQFRSPRRDTARTQTNRATVFNALAEGLACAAFLPGGIQVAGLRWEAQGADLSAPTGPARQRGHPRIITVHLPAAERLSTPDLDLINGQPGMVGERGQSDG